jgi:hypothetical protein
VATSILFVSHPKINCPSSSRFFIKQIALLPLAQLFCNSPRPLSRCTQLRSTSAWQRSASRRRHAAGLYHNTCATINPMVFKTGIPLLLGRTGLILSMQSVGGQLHMMQTQAPGLLHVLN